MMEEDERRAIEDTLKKITDTVGNLITVINKLDNHVRGLDSSFAQLAEVVKRMPSPLDVSLIRADTRFVIVKDGEVRYAGIGVATDHGTMHVFLDLWEGREVDSVIGIRMTVDDLRIKLMFESGLELRIIGDGV